MIDPRPLFETRAALIRTALIVGVPSLLAFALGFVGRPEQRLVLFYSHALNLLLVNLALVCVLAVMYVYGRVRTASAVELRQGVIAGASCAVLVAVILLASPIVMRVQADEMLIAAAGYGIWSGSGAVVPTGIFRTDGMLEPFVLLADKRGYLVPLLFAIVHFVRGYAFENGFVVNVMAGWIALVACYAISRRWLPPPTALASAFLLAAYPAFAWSIGSQGLEASNLAGLLLSVWVAMIAASNRDPRAACLVALLGPLVAQGRYESVVYGVISFVVALVVVVRAGASLRHLAVLAVTPFFFLPVAWQRARSFNFDVARIGAEEAFGMENFSANLRHSFDLFLFPSLENPSAPVAALFAVVGIAIAARRTRSGGVRAEFLALSAYGAGVAGLFVFILAFAWGNITRPETIRLGLVFMCAVSIAAATGIAFVRGAFTRSAWPDVALAACCTAIAIWTLPQDSSSNRQLQPPAINLVDADLRSVFPRCEFLIVTQYAPFFMLKGRSALVPEMLEHDWPSVHRHAEGAQIDAAIAVHIYSTRTGELLDDAHLPTGFAVRRLWSQLVDDEAWYVVYAIDHPALPLGHAGKHPECALGPLSRPDRPSSVNEVRAGGRLRAPATIAKTGSAGARS